MSSNDDGYVHDPARFDDGDVAESEDGDDWTADPVHPAEADREFGWRGWVLVGVILFAFVVAPVAIVLYPPGGSNYLFALIVLPLLPAVLLGLTAVWATTRP